VDLAQGNVKQVKLVVMVNVYSSIRSITVDHVETNAVLNLTFVVQVNAQVQLHWVHVMIVQPFVFLVRVAALKAVSL